MFGLRYALVASLMLQQTLMSRTETEALVKQDLAQRLKVRAGDVTVVNASDRTWTDPSFGCTARKGLGEPTPIPGFAFTLAHAGKQYVYHSDRQGHFRRCDPGKQVVSRTGS
jgi:hypothetical protein